MCTTDVTWLRAVVATLLLTASATAVAVAAPPVTRVEPASPAQCSARIGKLEFQQPIESSGRFSTFSAMVSVSCASSTSYRLSLASANGCRLRAGTQFVSYALFLDPTGTKPLLDCGPTKLEYTGNGSESIMIYGRTSATRSLSGDAMYAVGKYTDAIDFQVSIP
jgi:spore coat protein U-like protein